MINFSRVDQWPKDIALRLFEAIDISGQTLAINLTKLFDINELRKKFVVCAKDKGYNLNIIISTLISDINCDVLGLEESFQKTCFGYAFFKTCQYVITDKFFCKGDQYLSKLLGRFAKMSNLTKKIKKGQARMGESMC